MRMSNKKYLSNKKVLRKSKLNSMAKGGQPSQIQTLAKAVKVLQSKQKTQHQYQNYGVSESRRLISGPLDFINLSNYSSMTPIFGADGDDDNNYKMVHTSFGFDGYLSLENSYNNEESTISFTMFLVSLKDDIGDAFTPATGALSLTSGQHYYMQNGQCLLNKKCFNIHKIMRKTLTNFNTTLGTAAAKSQGGADFRFYIKHSPNCTITNVKGDWKALGSAQDPSKQRYLLIFNDDSTLDGESPALTYSIVHTVKTIV